VECSTAAQQTFNRAMALYHSFAWKPAADAFAAVAKADPSCGMAHWGRAMGLPDNPFVWPGHPTPGDRCAGISRAGNLRPEEAATLPLHLLPMSRLLPRPPVTRREFFRGFCAAGAAVCLGAGARAAVLTNAAGGIRDDLAVGSLVRVSDHVNLSGANPLTGPHDGPAPSFVDLSVSDDPMTGICDSRGMGKVGKIGGLFNSACRCRNRAEMYEVIPRAKMLITVPETI